MSKWSNASSLQKINNPTNEAYEAKIHAPEITFIGAEEQPDFATADITFYPDKSVIELKSLKLYFYQFRNTHISYERIINTIYDDLMNIYSPKRIRLVMKFNVRGGITSQLTIDSDWKVRGGKEEFNDWAKSE
ncbi:preQ(1) synthase [SAR202 cluster bacterium AC-647-P02_OGT_505m]|nr:preQ(1) synthase [SAR202 cluster bacterium AC-647-P02_OGT_505m]|tara:strand:- start:75 stop:473 length:399 start_codon:yes stop_codon:yes gene_type:complete